MTRTYNEKDTIRINASGKRESRVKYEIFHDFDRELLQITRYAGFNSAGNWITEESKVKNCASDELEEKVRGIMKKEGFWDEYSEMREHIRRDE